MPSDYAEIPASTAPNGEIPNPVRPMVNHGGWVLPYRGYAAHGVDPNSSPPHDVPSDLFDQAEVPVYEQGDPERATTPVPVRIVQESAKEARNFFTDQIGVSTVADAIVGKNEDRTSLMVKNLDANYTIYVGASKTTVSAMGYPLGPGEEISLNTSAPVYAVSPSGTVVVAILGEVTQAL